MSSRAGSMQERCGVYTPIAVATVWRIHLGRRYTLTELGLERHCARCGEWWPADTEFFPLACSKLDGLHSFCRACLVEYVWRYKRAARLLARAAEEA